MTHFVSVIVPAQNAAPRLGPALEALLNQTYPRNSYEIIVVDNRSTDGTRRVVQGFARSSDGRVILTEENDVQSSYAARNKGIGSARGDVLAFTDSDCVPASDWIERGVEALDASGASCGGGRVEFTFASDRPNVFEYYDSARKLDQERYVRRSGFAATANFFARKDLFDRHGLFRPDLVSGGDYEFGRRVTAQGESLIYIHDAIVRHPARGTLGGIIRKTRRVAKGQRQLAELGLLEGGPLWRLLLPAKSWPVDRKWSSSLTAFDKLALLVLQTLNRWLNLATRLKFTSARL